MMLSSTGRNYPRQDAGRYFASTSVPVPPQIHWKIRSPSPGAVPSDFTGCMVTFLPLVSLEMPWIVMVTLPASSVVTDATYFEAPLCSQFQLPAPGSTGEEANISVTDWRQVLPAMITSDIFARMV